MVDVSGAAIGPVVGSTPNIITAPSPTRASAPIGPGTIQVCTGFFRRGPRAWLGTKVSACTVVLTAVSVQIANMAISDDPYQNKVLLF
jgi:hypothetical protein